MAHRISYGAGRKVSSLSIKLKENSGITHMHKNNRNRKDMKSANGRQKARFSSN